MTDIVPVVTACDRNFLPGAWALLASLEQIEPARPVYLLDCGISDEEFEPFARRFPLVVRVPLAPPMGLPIPSVGSHATYARLRIADVVRDHRRALYLDADTVVLSSLVGLDALTLEPPYVVAACVEPYTPTFASNNGVADFATMGFTGTEPYFNAGVLLVDLDAWRRTAVAERAASYLRRTDIRITLFDQESLNVVLRGGWYPLAPEWNVSRYWMKPERRTGRPGILDDARVVHFLSKEKPWLEPDQVHPWLMDVYRRFAW